MKSITDYTDEEVEEMVKKKATLFKSIAGHSTSDLFTNFIKRYGYANYTFSGYIADLLIEKLGRMPTTEEILLIVDNGFSHFGATCIITDRYFSGKVYID